MEVSEPLDQGNGNPGGATGPARQDSTTIRVLIVDDHGHVREGIKAVLALDQGIRVVGEAVDGYEAIRAARALTPDVILMDLTMPVMDGFEATKRIRIEVPTARVLIVSQYDDEQYRNRAIMNGASGFLSKDSIKNALAPAIRLVASGGLSV